MAETSGTTPYFTKHLFRAGLQCPTKLYYKARGYPEDRSALPFLMHAGFNRKLLKSLIRSVYPAGKYIDGDTIEESAARTREYFEASEIVLFDPVFTCRQMMAKLPLVVKNGQQLTVFQVQTKAFSSRKHQLLDRKGDIPPKWRKYLLGFAYQLYILQKAYPGCSVLPLLVLPDKAGYAQTDGLPALLKPFETPAATPPSVPGENQQLLAKLDVREPVRRVREDPGFAETYLPKPSFPQSVEYLREIYLREQKVEPEVGYKCRNCEFNIGQAQQSGGAQSGFGECWESKQPGEGGDDPDHVFELMGPGTRQLMEREIFYQRNIDNGDIHSVASIAGGEGRITETMRRALQIHKTTSTEVPGEIMRASLRKELRRWEYPLHFLDFEAGNYAVPVRRGRPPYHLVVFQFSCHTLRKDGRWQHHQWIDSPGNGYPNYELVRRLMEIPHISKGTIVQYSNFERNALKIIRRELRDEAEMVPDSPRLIRWIEDIIRRNDSNHPPSPYLADLSRLVKNYYYNNEMENSLSIKDVLQSVMTRSDYLAKAYSKPYNSQNFEEIIWWQSDSSGKARNPYTILEESGSGAVRRGTEAMYIYGKLIAGNMSKKEKSAYRKSLLRYCELDTLAMVMIYQHWKQTLNRLY
ncbi:protein of unknown function [Fodinibius roseus]|uniref:DUF2779 domain-containing protein n=1 Tax=Fodinibius roseus TaxID=1194090 RepID=A0A1M5DFF7_9BACT|nr:DUF2779 domain-containing protein [Fodinibius roseus]SHF65803.1 protein of unknown function [Fodinibius roseus]